jgi:hypothetical protein
LDKIYEKVSPREIVVGIVDSSFETYHLKLRRKLLCQCVSNGMIVG